MSFSYFFPGLFLLFGLWLGVARSPFLDEFKHWTFLYSNSRFEIIFLESMRFWAHGGEASPSSKKLIMGNPEIWLDFSLSFLDEFLKDFAGTFLVFGLWLGVARSPFLEQFYLYRFLYSNSRLEIISMRFLRHWGSAAGCG